MKKKNDRVTVAEAAKRLGCCMATVRSGVKKGLLEGIARGICGRVYWVTTSSLERLERDIAAGGAR